MTPMRGYVCWLAALGAVLVATQLSCTREPTPVDPATILLTLGDLPSGFSLARAESTDNVAVAQGYPDPEAMKARFDEWGREGGFAVEYRRRPTLADLAQGPTLIVASAGRYGGRNGAQSAFLYINENHRDDWTELSLSERVGDEARLWLREVQSDGWTFRYAMLDVRFGNFLTSVAVYGVPNAIKSTDPMSYIRLIEKRLTKPEERVTIAEFRPTPEPTATAVPRGRTRSDPLGAGETLVVGDLEIQVLSVDYDAWPKIRATNRFNDPPPTGQLFVMTTLSVTSRGKSDSTTSISKHDFDLVGDAGVLYRPFMNSCGVIPGELGATLYGGGKAQGNTCHAVRDDDDHLILVYKGGYIALPDKAAVPTPTPSQAGTGGPSISEYLQKRAPLFQQFSDASDEWAVEMRLFSQFLTLGDTTYPIVPAASKYVGKVDQVLSSFVRLDVPDRYKLSHECTVQVMRRQKDFATRLVTAPNIEEIKKLIVDVAHSTLETDQCVRQWQEDNKGQ